MKTLNTKLIVLTITTLILTGCMPDSLTKFKKEETKKPAPAPAKTTGEGVTVVPPVVDENGNAITFDPSTVFSFTTPNITATVGVSTGAEATLDGSLGDDTKTEKFFEKCELVTTTTSDTTTTPGFPILGVHPESTVLPAGLSLSPKCILSGTPTQPKSVISGFCSDRSSSTQATCEITPLQWSDTYNKCNLPDLKYSTKTACQAGFHKWYGVGNGVPYRIRLTYHNADGIQGYYYSTLPIGVFKIITGLEYTQSNKLQLKVSGTSSYSTITPLLTTTSTSGAYPRYSIITSNQSVYGVAKFTEPTSSYIGINKLDPIKVASTSPFTEATFITKSGDSSIIGRIFKIDSSNRILYVENISPDNKSFTAGDNICANNLVGVCGTSYPISSINTSAIFKVATPIDNDKQFYSEKFQVAVPTNVFEVGSPITALSPISTTELTTANAVTYTVSPALPCNNPADPNDCISLDSETGAISGTFSGYLSATQFTITARNPISSITKAISISAIVGPTDISVANHQIITVNSNGAFNEGETLYQPISPPATEAASARIIKKIGSFKMAIETLNGEFKPGASLDSNGSAFQAEKAVIIPYGSCTDVYYTTKATCEAASQSWAPSAPVYYNAALSISSTGSYAIGNTITSVSGTGTNAAGIVSDIETSVTDILYVKYLTKSALTPATAPTFYQGDGLNLGSTITKVEAPNLKIGVASATSFTKGSDVVTSAGYSAYTYAVASNILSINEISKASGATSFTTGQTIYNHETIALSTANQSIASVTYDNFMIFERGKSMSYRLGIEAGNGIVYSISPNLPTGLTLNTVSGEISGTASSISARQNYLITGTNFIGSATYAVAIEVKDYFEIKEKSGASSFILHKVGDYENSRRCRVDASDISSLTNNKALDIRCFLDGEEQDINQTKIVFASESGPTICQYVEYDPYMIDSWSTLPSTEVSARYPVMSIIRTGGNGTLVNSGPLPSTSLCDSNYNSYDNSFPNCDEGYLSYWQESYSPTNVYLGRTKINVSCGGEKYKCLNGPIKDVFTDTQLKLGNRVQIIAANTGYTKTYTHKAPLDFGDSSTMRVANGVTKNSCTSSAADALTWKNNTAAKASYRSPFGSHSNPFYTFKCLNAAYEIKARIRVIVRDWNETFNITKAIYNQSPSAPASQMNNNGTDTFGENFNDSLDFDDEFVPTYVQAPSYTGGSCATMAAGSCSAITNFEYNLQCTSKGGAVNTSASCSDPVYLDKPSCERASETWTNTSCTLPDQFTCEYFGGTWTGDQEFKFPNGYIPSINQVYRNIVD